MTGNALGDNRQLRDSIQYLNEHGIEWDTDNSSPSTIAAKLRSLLVDEATLNLTYQYLEDLRADDYGKRESASRELAKLRVPIDPLLGIQHAPSPSVENGNLEFTWRLQQILAVRRTLALEDQLYHALVVIAESPLPGLTPELMSTASALEGGDVRLIAVAEHAISKSLSPSDKAYLRSLLGTTPSIPTRRRATAALAQLEATSNLQSLDQLLAAGDPRLRIAAARGAALAGSVKAIPILVAMLDDPSVTLRCEASALLHQYTNQDFGYAGYDAPAHRAKSVEKWKNWLSKHSTETTQRTLQPDTSSGRVIVGIQLKEASKIQEGRRRPGGSLIPRSNVIEFTPSGSIRWHMRSADLRGGTAIAAIPLANGARAIAFGSTTDADEAFQQNLSIRFFGNNGQPLGSLSGLACMPVLGSNKESNLLVAAANEIVEIGLLGNVVHRTALGDTNATVDFFASARGTRIIIASSRAGTVREFSRDGVILFERTDLTRPIYARRMPDGGLIVAQQVGREREPAIIHYGASGSVTWTFTPPQEIGKMSAVAALSNSSVLFGSTTGLYEIGNSGRITRTWINGSVRFVYAD